MNYKILTLIVFTFFLYSCDQLVINQSKNKNFKIDNNILFAKKVIKICNQILR